MFGRNSQNQEIVIAGAGPSGLALACELARLGLRTTVMDPALMSPWKNSFGGFEYDARGLDLSAAVTGRFERPMVFSGTGKRTVLEQPYLRFSSEALKTLLLSRARLAGVSLDVGSFVASDVATFPGLVVDATGTCLLTPRRELSPDFFQSAYGLWIEATGSRFSNGEMALMDYRDQQEPGSPSFLYSMPEGESERATRLFVQETVLVSKHPVELNVLRERLLRRLQRQGISIISELGEERCLIPMGAQLPNSDEPVFSFGASAGLIHPATGYQLLRALRLAGPVAQAIADGLHLSPQEAIAQGTDQMWPPHQRLAWQIYRFGAAVLSSFGPSATSDFIHAFFGLKSAEWLGFMTGTLEPQKALRVMWRVFKNAPVSLRVELLKASSLSGGHALRSAFLTN